jgi:GTPase Era involved in 16S rRNA processing
MSSRRSSDNDANRGYSCGFCGERFQTSYNMGIHLMICANETSRCPRCNKNIPRATYCYHVDYDCTNLVNSTTERRHTMNASSDRMVSETPKKFDSLLETATHAHKTLGEVYYQSELDHVVEKLQFNIIVIGSPRVGKSELINALCNGKNRAETSLSLNSCTKEVKCYALEDNPERNLNVKPFKINFYDTPGIESWGNKAGETSMLQFIEQTNPVCVIYCASPGSFAKLEQLHSVLEHCKTKEIFCALVCTNMWSGNQRDMVINEFQKELAFFGEKIDKFSRQLHSSTPHKVTFFGKGALCTMVNSIEYHDSDFSEQRKPVQGIDELIHGIMLALDHDKLLGWCYAVLYRRSYWEKISQKIGGFFSLRFEDLHELITTSPYFNDWFSKKKAK